MSQKEIYVFVFGDAQVGKTTLIHKFIMPQLEAKCTKTLSLTVFLFNPIYNHINQHYPVSFEYQDDSKGPVQINLKLIDIPLDEYIEDNITQQHQQIAMSQNKQPKENQVAIVHIYTFSRKSEQSKERLKVKYIDNIKDALRKAKIMKVIAELQRDDLKSQEDQRFSLSLPQQSVPQFQKQEMARSQNTAIIDNAKDNQLYGLPLFQTSSKTGYGINELLQHIIQNTDKQSKCQESDECTIY